MVVADNVLKPGRDRAKMNCLDPVGLFVRGDCITIPSTTKGLQYLNPRGLCMVGSEMVLGSV